MFHIKASIKSFLPQTLLGRSMLILILPVLLLQIFTIYMFFDRHWSRVTSRLAFAVAGEVSVIADTLEGPVKTNPLLPQAMNNIVRNLDLSVTFDMGARLSPVSGTASPLKQLVIDTLSEALTDQVHRPFTVRLLQDEEKVEIKVQLKTGVLNVTASQRRLYSSSSYIFLLWMMGTSILLSVIAIFFMRKQIRPIRTLAIAAEQFGKGQDILPFKPEGAREIRAAARAFLDMHDRIKRQVEQRTAMLAGVSHDLRTPLTRLKLGISLLPEGPDTDALKEDIKVMEQMISAYLGFIRGQGDEATSPVDLSGLLRDVAAQMARANRAGDGCVQTLSIPDGLMLTGARAGALSRAFSNILGNAYRYAKTLEIGARENAGYIYIDIDDDGCGIPEDKRADVFRPFVRLDPARRIEGSGEVGHVGLGLSIAQDIIQSHGGQIHLDHSKTLGGLKVRITLPI